MGEDMDAFGKDMEKLMGDTRQLASQQKDAAEHYRELGEALGRTDGRAGTLTGNMQALQKCLAEADRRVHGLQRDLTTNSEHLSRLDSKVEELKESHMGVCDRHLNLVGVPTPPRTQSGRCATSSARKARSLRI